MSSRTRPTGPLLRINGPVRRAIGDREAAALSAGLGLPPDAQCYRCGRVIDLAAGTQPAALSVVESGPGYLAAYACPGCSVSQVFTAEAFSALVATLAYGPTVPTHRPPKVWEA